MKSYDKKPINENIEEALKTNSLNLNDKIFKTAELLDSLDCATSICLNGKWGCGKTFFVKELQLLLDCINPFSKKSSESIKKITGNLELNKTHATIYFDAWENDFHQDPLLSLIYVIARQFSLEYKLETIDFDNEIKKVLGAILSKIPILEKTIDFKEILDEKYVNAFLSSIKKENDIQKAIKDFFSSLAAEHGDRILIIIDELDRCRPDYAIQLLERVKHYMNCEQITFLFAMNATELESIVKQYYGQDFNATGYLDKFFDLRLALPPVSIEAYLDYIGINSSSSVFSEICRREICKILQFEKREINRFCLLTDIAVKNFPNSDFSADPDENSILLIKNVIIPCVLGLRLKATNRYEQFINGKDGTLLKELLKGKYLKRFTTNFTSDLTKEEINDTILLQRIEEYYKELFTFDFSGMQKRYQVSNYRFDQSQRELLLNAISIISDYTDFN